MDSSSIYSKTIFSHYLIFSVTKGFILGEKLDAENLATETFGGKVFFSMLRTSFKYVFKNKGRIRIWLDPYLKLFQVVVGSEINNSRFTLLNISVFQAVVDYLGLPLSPLCKGNDLSDTSNDFNLSISLQIIMLMPVFRKIYQHCVQFLIGK